MAEAQVISEADIDRALAYLRESIDVASKARADMVVTEQWIKTTKAKLMSKSGASAVSAQEVIALASPEFEASVNAYGAAVQLFEFHKMKRETAGAWIEAWRTQSSNERAQGKIG
jgi:hypothetical protein